MLAGYSLTIIEDQHSWYTLKGTGKTTVSFLFSRNKGTAALRPLSFEEFRRRQSNQLDRELLDGALSERPVPPLAHETLRLWLHRVLSGWIEVKNWGAIYDSATPVKIAKQRGRRPDLSLVSRACRSIVRQGALYGAPDIIIEIIHANDLRDALAARERDYRLLGVREIVLIDPVRRQVRVLRRVEAETIMPEVAAGNLQGPLPFTVETLYCGQTLRLRELNGVCLPVSALMAELRPPVSEILNTLLLVHTS